MTNGITRNLTTNQSIPSRVILAHTRRVWHPRFSWLPTRLPKWPVFGHWQSVVVPATVELDHAPAAGDVTRIGYSTSFD